LYRFTKKVQQSGVLKEARSRRFRKRVGNKLKRKLSALHREGKRVEIVRKKKLGLL
jgi:ribosomal protein S21